MITFLVMNLYILIPTRRLSLILQRLKRTKRIVNKVRTLDLNMDPFDYEARDFIDYQYNVDLDTFTPEEKVKFVDKENLKMLEKVNQLSEALNTVLEKIKSK